MRKDTQKPSGKREKRPVYRLALLAYCAVLLLSAAVVLCLVWCRCNSFQKGQSDVVALKYVEDMSEEDWLKELKGAVFGSACQTREESAASAYALFKGGDFEAFRSSKKTDDEQKKSAGRAAGRVEVCNVVCSGKKICSITLKESGRGAFGEPRWRVAKLKMDGEFLDSVNPEISVLAPAGCALLLDGKRLEGISGRAAASPFATEFESGDKPFLLYEFRAPCGMNAVEAVFGNRALQRKSAGENTGENVGKSAGERAYAFDFSDENKKTAAISVPAGSKVYINGVQLTTDYISAENAEYPFLSPLEKGRTDAPKSTEYRVGGLYRTPKVRAVCGGCELKCPDSGESAKGLYLFPLGTAGFDYTLTVPSGAAVAVNGREVTDDDRFIAADGIEYGEVSDYKDELVNPKVCRVYKFKNLLLKPQISVKDASGAECPLVQTGKCAFGCDLPPLAGEISGYESLAGDFGVAMMEYMFLGRENLNEGFRKVLSFVRTNSKAYEVIRDSYVGMYWRRTHTIEYKYMYVDNYVSYADNSFRCDLHYNVTGTRVSDPFRKDHVVGIYRLLYIKDKSKDEGGKDEGGWKIVELSLLKDDEKQTENAG